MSEKKQPSGEDDLIPSVITEPSEAAKVLLPMRYAEASPDGDDPRSHQAAIGRQAKFFQGAIYQEFLESAPLDDKGPQFGGPPGFQNPALSPFSPISPPDFWHRGLPDMVSDPQCMPDPVFDRGFPSPTSPGSGCPSPTSPGAGCPAHTSVAAGCHAPTSVAAGCPPPTTPGAGCRH